jgi:hypothetical protein
LLTETYAPRVAPEFLRMSRTLLYSSGPLLINLGESAWQYPSAIPKAINATFFIKYVNPKIGGSKRKIR